MADSIRPFLLIWTEPRATIRRIVEIDPRRYVIALALVGGGLGTLETAWFTALGNPSSIGALWPITVALRVAVGAVWGVIGLYAAAWLIGIFCRVLGGVASPLEMRAALAWSTIPGITASLMSIVAVLIGAISPPEFRHSRLPMMTGSTIELGLLNGVLIVWGFIVQMKCVGEVNRFSAWRALGAILLMGAVLLGLLLIAVYFASAMPHHMHR